MINTDLETDRQPDLEDISTNTSQDSPDYLASLRLVYGFMKGAHIKLILAIILATLSVALELVPVWAIYQLILSVIDKTVEWSTVGYYAVISFTALILGFSMLGLSMGLSHVIAFDALYQLRKAIAHHMTRLPLGYYSDKKSGDAKKLIIDEPEKLELIIAHGLPEGVSALASWFAISVWLFIVDWRMALATIFVTPVSFILLATAMKRGGKWASAYQSTGQTMNASIIDYLAGMAAVKIFNRSGESLAQTKEAITAYTEIEKKWGREYMPLGGTFFSLVLTNIMFILPAGLFLLAADQITLSTLIFFIILGANYSQPLLKLFNQFHQLAHISMGSMLVSELLTAEMQADNKQQVSLTDFNVTFRGVSFGYKQFDVLHDISFTAQADSITALVGPSGSGKSTIASLIPRFWDVRSGEITLGDVNVRDISLSQLMDTVAFVFQDTFLFSDTIAENIRFGNPDASDQEIKSAAEAAQAHEFISALPDGYQTLIGNNGTQLSGGERQRIAIARAILKNAPIVILDEATAFADPDNETAIQKAIGALAKGKNLIVIAHRLHTIINADQIIVIDKGKLVESGRHPDLVTAGKQYATLWQDYNAAKNISLRSSEQVITGEIA